MFQQISPVQNQCPRIELEPHTSHRDRDRVRPPAFLFRHVARRRVRGPPPVRAVPPAALLDVGAEGGREARLPA